MNKDKQQYSIFVFHIFFLLSPYIMHLCVFLANVWNVRTHIHICKGYRWNLLKNGFIKVAYNQVMQYCKQLRSIYETNVKKHEFIYELI